MKIKSKTEKKKKKGIVYAMANFYFFGYQKLKSN